MAGLVEVNQNRPQTKRKKIMKYLVVAILVLCVSEVNASQKFTVQNRNGTIQQKIVQNGNNVNTYGRNGSFQGSYRQSGNTFRQTVPGFRRK